MPAAAAALAQQVFETLAGRRVLVVGAGAMSEQTARNLVSRGAPRSWRSPTGARIAAQALPVVSALGRSR